ncbi:sensor histidine kinase [Polymorphobacter arshaanensis]|uniref:Sensor histidine kinase n=1 Tax=Glacieibacterium arshaanense TaxID=2511025 RepID=A0A4Y9EQI9_9SPHN|nr:histidine kinase [Polymorphobacter arshaanensis]TFU05539.1 sensor histidine kinase [Polymorphobacter arshaanensis]
MASPPQTAPFRVPPRVALASILGFWAFYFVINTVRTAAFHEGPGELDMLGRRTVVSLFGIGLTALFYLLLRRVENWPLRRLVATVLVGAVPLSLAYAAINFTAFYIVSPAESTLAEIAKYPDKHVSPFMLIAEAALNWYFFIVAWGILWIALANAERVRHAERLMARYRAEAQTAELRALRYQVNPHFLFNTLNSLSSLVLAGRNADAEAMIINLANFFRSSLSGDPAADVPLADEIALQKLYLGIEAVRFPARLISIIDVPDSVADVRVPGLILQPLVENAIKHGVAPTQRPVTLTIRARAEGVRLHITVEDDGNNPGTVPCGGVGWRNVCDRLAARYGDRARCEAGPLPGGGYRASLWLPLAIDGQQMDARVGA